MSEQLANDGPKLDNSTRKIGAQIIQNALLVGIQIDANTFMIPKVAGTKLLGRSIQEGRVAGRSSGAEGGGCRFHTPTTRHPVRFLKTVSELRFV
jgi:hypothetical protein